MRAYGFQYGLGCLVCCLLWRAPPVATPLVAPPAPETPMLAAPVPARPTGARTWSKIGLGNASASNAGIYVAQWTGFFQTPNR